MQDICYFFCVTPGLTGLLSAFGNIKYSEGNCVCEKDLLLLATTTFYLENL